MSRVRVLRFASLRRAQQGFSLVEAMLAIMITSSVLVGAAVAMWSTQRVTSANVSLARLQMSVSSYTDALQAMPYTRCASAATYLNYDSDPSSATNPLGPPWTPTDTSGSITATITKVEYAYSTRSTDSTYHGRMSVFGDANDVPACQGKVVVITSQTDPDYGKNIGRNAMQRITVRLTWTSGAAAGRVRTATIVKRDPDSCASADACP